MIAHPSPPRSRQHVIVAAESGFLYWVSIQDFEIAYAKDTETKGVFAAAFTPDYSSFVCADLSSTLVHAQVPPYGCQIMGGRIRRTKKQ